MGQEALVVQLRHTWDQAKPQQCGMGGGLPQQSTSL